MPFTFGSLFSGIGGLDLGMDRAGGTCVYQCEIDDYASRVLTKHWPDVIRFRDVREIGKHNLPYVDVIAGGFPCQDISYAGKGAGLEGARSGLWYEYARIIGEMGPSVVIVENVSALLTRGLDAVLGTLASLGYDAQWHCIPAAAVGAPHIRDRVFLIAYTNGKRFKERYVPPITSESRFTCGANDAVYVTDPNSITGSQTNTEPCASDGTRLSWDNDGGSYWEREPEPKRTMPQRRVRRVDDGVSDRVQRLRTLGNAVVPQVAEYVTREFVLPYLEGQR